MGELNCTISPDGKEIYCNELATNFVLGDESFAADEDYLYTYDSSLGGYVVNVIDKNKSSYDPICTGINGYQTVKLSESFLENNEALTVAPAIPNTVTIIGNRSFYGCDNLRSVTFPDSVTSVGDNAFQWCENLTNIAIPNSVANIGFAAFNNCTGITAINFAGSMEQWNNITFGENWNLYVPATEVICSDGTVSLN